MKGFNAKPWYPQACVNSHHEETYGCHTSNSITAEDVQCRLAMQYNNDWCTLN